uniref:Uncharacterized protein n=1 Tax=Cyprinus carpio carpio TaxID=630221 RepID=A0A9J8AB31_CYPCA
MNQLCILLLALWSAFNPWQMIPIYPEDNYQRPRGDGFEDLDSEIIGSTEFDEYDTNPWQMIPSYPEDNYQKPRLDGFEDLDSEIIGSTEFDEYDTNVPGPNITVYRQTEDREHVIVLCKFGMTHGWQSFELSVESELYYIEQCTLYYSEMCVFLVTVRPPASFTCVHGNLRSQTYNYSVSVSDHPEEGASLLYICFSSFIAVGLFIMTAAVIVINIRSKTEDTDSTAVTDNDYV